MKCSFPRVRKQLCYLLWYPTVAYWLLRETTDVFLLKEDTIFGLALSYSLNLFQGPYLSKLRNVLQRTLGDDNILMVKFGEVKDDRDSGSRSLDDYFSKYNKVLGEGIHVGLRCYRFFG